MNTVPSKNQQDLSHLNLLSIFHYVVAAITALLAMFPVIHLVMGILIVSGAWDNIDGQEDPPQFIGWFLIAVASMFILAGLAVAFLTGVAGYKLKKHRSYRFCFVMAIIQCMIAPFGTVLGIFTILVLVKPNVKRLFGQK